MRITVLNSVSTENRKRSFLEFNARSMRQLINFKTLFLQKKNENLIYRDSKNFLILHGLH